VEKALISLLVGAVQAGDNKRAKAVEPNIPGSVVSETRLSSLE